MQREGINIYFIAALGAVLMVLPQHYQVALRLDFDLFLRGEVWRAITGHLCHLSWQHYALNLLGLVVLQQLFSNHFTGWHWLIPTLFITLCVSLALVLLSQELKWYVGLSGVLIGLFYLCALQHYDDNKFISLTVLLGLTLYIGIQQYSGEIIQGVTDELPVASRAHLYGAIAGVVWAILAQLKTKFKN